MSSQADMVALITELEAAVGTGDCARLRRLIASSVDGYHLQSLDEQHP